MYPVLHGLETEGLVTVSVERQGLRSRRVYSLTSEGHRRLAQERQRWQQQNLVLQQVLWRERVDG